MERCFSGIWVLEEDLKLRAVVAMREGPLETRRVVQSSRALGSMNRMSFTLRLGRKVRAKAGRGLHRMQDDLLKWTCSGRRCRGPAQIIVPQGACRASRLAEMEGTGIEVVSRESVRREGRP